MQQYVSHLVGRMECVILTLGTVTVLLDSLAPPVMMVGKRASFIEQHTIPHLLSDIRECEVKNGGCDQVCTDFPGGYNCSCRSGFETDGPSCIGMPFTLATDKCKICYGMSTDTCVKIIVVTYH